jgi:hypothetical protein
VVGSSFNCSNIGNNLVTLTANDGNGNTNTCNATVTVRDVTPQVAKCQNLTANLGSNGTVTVPASSINNGSTDNCSMTFTLTPNTFTCAQIGMRTVTLTATDPGGNTSTCTAKVTVRDITGPTAKCNNPIIFLNSTGEASLSVAQVNNGSTDNCGISTLTINKTAFNCSEIGGPQTVILSVTDVNGNTSSCYASVTVKDAIAPTAICEDVMVQLGLNGKVTVYGAELAANSFDNCSVWSYSPIAKVYTSANLGQNNLTILVKDWSGNGATCVSVVTVEPHGNLGENEDRDADAAPADFAFNVYPNPTSGDVSVAFELPLEQQVRIRVFDLQGRLVLNREETGLEGDNTLQMHLGAFAPGVYILDFQSEGLKAQRRLMVQE